MMKVKNLAKMKAFDENPSNEIPKALTGIEGFDQITRGACPAAA
jgi:hypothetical protein